MTENEAAGQEALEVSPQPLTFDVLFEREFDYVCHSLRRLGVRGADLEDVAQEVFWSVHRRFAEFDPSRAARPWLLAFAYRAASNYRRGQRRRTENLDADPRDPNARSAPAEAEAALVRADLQSVLDQMPMERTVVLLMFDVDGYSAPEIAEALELPLNTVYSRVRLARRDFRELGAHLFSREVHDEA